MIRLDKYISNLGLASRSTVVQRCKEKRIEVDNQIILKSDTKIPRGSIISIKQNPKEGYTETCLSIEIDTETQKDNNTETLTFEVKENITVILYKPMGYVCSDVEDGGHPSYRELLKGCPYVHMLHVAGRLDRDTTGLVIATSDGDLNHRIISPKHKLIKTYHVGCAQPVSDKMRQCLENGVTLDDGYMTMPARVLDYYPDQLKISMASGYNIVLQISEGKYHQVKRMLQAVGNEVIRLHRASVGDWNLDYLKEGERKYI